MIKSIHYKVDKYDVIGIRSHMIFQYNNAETSIDKTYLRIETLIVLGKDNTLLRGMKTNNNIFNITQDYSKAFYFPFLETQFIGKAIIKMNRNYEIISMALSEVDYGSFPIADIIGNALMGRKPGLIIKGDIPVIWKPVMLDKKADAAIRTFVRGYII